MPNTSNQVELKRLALIGAQGRIEALRAEIASLVNMFPELKNAAGTNGRGGRTAKKAASAAATGGRSRNWNMSSAQRKAVSARMKKYWAARRKEKATTAKA
jgi:hypothetical protein